jgi:hypothetical protein
MSFNFIYNPLTNGKYSIFSYEGKSLLKQYIKEYQTGGSRARHALDSQGNMSLTTEQRNNRLLEERILNDIVNSVINPKSQQPQQQQQQQQQRPQTKCDKIINDRERIEKDARTKLQENNNTYLVEGCSEEARQAFNELNPFS